MKRKVLLIGVVIALIICGYYIHNRFFYDGELIGIKGTLIYHRDNCQFVKKSYVDKLIFFKSADDAISRGYRPCKTCNPPAQYQTNIIDKILEIISNNIWKIIVAGIFIIYYSIGSVLYEHAISKVQAENGQVLGDSFLAKFLWPIFWIFVGINLIIVKIKKKLRRNT